ncbi:MAG TPA: hypothetical protein VKM55_08135 [Candidatus Lokiarchaeia archaeon]|nr:hypothetical protein [Candidatus Lokiarchaeia archaeon]
MLIQIAPTEINQRDIIFALDSFILFICLELSLLFLTRAVKRDHAWRVNLGWGIVFGDFGLMQAVGMYVTFFLTADAFIQIQQPFEALSQIPIITVIALLEYFYQKYHKTRFAFTLGAVVVGVLYFLLPLKIAENVFGTYFVVLIFFVLAFFVKLIRISSGVIRKNISIFIIAFCVLNLGNFMTNIQTMAVLSQMGIQADSFIIIGRILKLGSLIVIFLVLERLPVFMEVNWKENLLQLLVIHKKSGIAIFHEKFTDESNSKTTNPGADEELVAGGIVGITTLLKEISQSAENIKLFDHGDVKILCEYGSNTLVVLYVKEDYQIYREKIIHIRTTIEELFGSVLEAWNGDIAYFDPLNVIVKKEFR